MMYYYSAQTRGFYTLEIHGVNMPSDVVEVSDEQHRELMEGQGNGKEIVPGKHGYPILQDPPPPTQEQLDREQKKSQARAAALQKLTDLGLTSDDLEALGLKSGV